MPTKIDPHDVLLAIATDLLAQSEAQLRTATRLEGAARHFVRGGRPAVVPPIEQIRGQLRVLRDLFEVERALLDEFERNLSGAST